MNNVMTFPQLECCAVRTEGWALYLESKWIDEQVWNPGRYPEFGGITQADFWIKLAAGSSGF